MSAADKNGGRGHKISPVLNKNSKFAYSPCPKNDPDSDFLHPSSQNEIKCSAISSPINPSADTNFPNQNEHTISNDHFLDAHTYQPLIQRTSMGNIYYSSSKSTSSVESSGYANAPIVTGTKVNFSGHQNGAFVSSRSEPISLSTLDQDCFVIPIRSLDRFLPAGIPLPAAPIETKDPLAKQGNNLSVLEVNDSKICILVHLLSPFEAIDPVLESPLVNPLVKQRATASELLYEIQQEKNASSGMLLANMERYAEFPFIAYYSINAQQTDPQKFFSGVRCASLSKFEPKSTRYSVAHTLDLYKEVAAICRPPLQLLPNEQSSAKRTPSTGFIISVYKVFEGDDGERFERNWLYWTGARMIYLSLPRSAGLRKITLHKSVAKSGDKMYLLICECADLLKDLSSAAYLIPALRARLCGYIGLYKILNEFNQSHTSN